MEHKSKTLPIDVDYLLQLLKPTGFFQMAQFTLLALTYVVDGGSLLKIIFIGLLPEVKCAELNETQLIEYGYEDNSSLLVKYEKCHIKILNLNNSTNHTISCINGYSYVPDRSTSFVSEFDLVCDKEGYSELTQTLYSAGGLVSNTFAPIITDKYGRKPVFVTFAFLLFSTGLGLAFVKNYWTFAALRLLEGIMNHGMIGPAFTLMVEVIPAKQRTLFASSTGVIWGCSIVALTPLAYFFRNFSWRIKALVFVSLGGIVFVEMWYIEESLRWLITNGKMERSKKIVRRAAKENKVDFDEVWRKFTESSTTLIPTKENSHIEEENEEERENEPTPPSASSLRHSISSMQKVGKVGLTTVFKDATARKISLVLLLNGLFNALTYNTIYMTAAELSGNYYLNFFLTSLSEVVGNGLMMIMIYKFERRTTIVFFQVLSGSALVVGAVINFAFDANSIPAAVKVIPSLIGMLGISASFCLIWLYAPEIYPTNIRNIGLGMIGISSTVGTMISPFSRVIVQYVPWLPSAVTGTGTILSSLLFFTLPESRGKQMPTTMDEIREWKQSRKQEKWELKNC